MAKRKKSHIAKQKPQRLYSERQLFAIDKSDWCVAWGRNAPLWKVSYYYCSSLKEAREYAKGKKGFIQYFRLSYEFKAAKVVK